MAARVISVWPGCAKFHQIIAKALEVLRGGGVVAYPTDTLYGLGANAYLPAAVEKVFAIKGRAAEKALPLLLAETQQMREVAEDIPAIAWDLADALWPGPLTMVLCRSPRVPDIVVGKGPTVAVRVPHHAVPLALAAGLGAPITGTSANRAGGPAPIRAPQVAEALGSEVDLILDAGPCPGGIGSTVLDLTVSPPRVLRQGAVTMEELRRVLGDKVDTLGGAR